MCSTEKDTVFTFVKNIFPFCAQFYYTKSTDMMREMERVFENLKEDFKRKISSEPFIGYFVKQSDVSEDLSSSDSFEDISIDTIISPTTAPRKRSSCSHILNISPESSKSLSRSSTTHDSLSDEEEKEEVSEKEGCGKADVFIDKQVENNVNLQHEEDDNLVITEGNDECIVEDKDPKIESTVGPNKVMISDNICDTVVDADCENNDNYVLHCSEKEDKEELGIVSVDEMTQEDRHERSAVVVVKEDVSYKDDNVFEDDLSSNTTIIKGGDDPHEYLQVIEEENVTKEVGNVNDEYKDGHLGEIGAIDIMTLCEDEKRKTSDNERDDENKTEQVYGSFKDSITELHSPEGDEELVTDDDNAVFESIQSPEVPETGDMDLKEDTTSDEMTRTNITHIDADLPTVPKIAKKQSLQRMMWSETPEVLESGILKKLSKKQIQLQEAMFEIIISEYSYYQSLMILTTHFFDSDLFKVNDNKDSLASPIDKHHIFSNVILIISTSQKFLNDLEQRWLDEKPVLSQICDIILEHAGGDDFQNYVTYLRNQEYQSKALRRLIENDTFKQQLNKLETSSSCGKLSMDSYLMLPMQRLTRLKLLVDAILKLFYCDELKDIVQEEHINTAEMTLEKLKKLLDASDSEKGFMDQKSTIMSLMNKMDFPPTLKRIAISNKVFIKEDELIVHQQNPLKHVRKFSKKRQPTICLILFNDLLILAKKKGPRLLIIDYCDRVNIEATETKYKAVISNADVSNNMGSVDYDDRVEIDRKMSVTSIARSKTSLSPEDWKRYSASISNSFKSMPMISRNDEQEIISNSFSLKLDKSQTDIFSIPIVLVARNKVERDDWLALLMNPTLGNNVDGKFSTNDGKLHKTTSLRNNANRKEDFGINKTTSLYAKRKDEILDQILAQREIAQDCADDFVTISYNYRINFGP